jgi:hypothetical protein
MCVQGERTPLVLLPSVEAGLLLLGVGDSVAKEQDWGVDSDVVRHMRVGCVAVVSLCPNALLFMPSLS